MANVFTNLEQDALIALDTVLQEPVGFLGAVNTDFSSEMLAKDRTIRSFVAPASTAADTTASQLPPDTGDQTFTNKTLSITKDRHVAIRWTAEDMLQMNGGGPGASRMLQDQLKQAYRTLRNEIETDLGSLYVEASRAHQSLGSALFDSTGGVKDIAAAKQILIDNGTPDSDLHLVLGSTDVTNYYGVPNLYKANEANDDSFLRRGVLGRVFGVDVRHSGQVAAHTAGTASSATTDNAGYSVGDTEITLDSAGTGAILAGDIITFNGDTNQYVVASGDADVSGGGTITLAAPGLKQAIAASTTAITVVDSANRNMIFNRNAIALATRLPAVIDGEADQRVVVQDPETNLAFQILTYYEHKRMHMQVGIAWGYAMMKPEMAAVVIA
jgi:hypothetical protein